MRELTMAERDIMKCLWESENPLSVTELHEMLCDKFGRKWTYKTVASFLRGLRMKGRVTSSQVAGKRSHFFSPTISEKEYREELVKYLKEYWFNGDAYEMLMTCAKEDLVGAETLAKFKESLNTSI